MDDSVEAVRRLMLATTRIDEAYYVIAKRLGIRENTLALLYALDDGKAHYQSEISASWLIPKTTISTSVHELINNGYVELLPSENSREKIICLTDSGRAYTSRILRNVYKAEQSAIKSAIGLYSQSFVEAIEYFAHRLCDELEKETIE